MTSPVPVHRPRAVLLAAAALVLGHLALVLHGAARHSAAFDELFYAPAGYATLTTGDQRLNREHPPVMKLLAGAAWLGTGRDARATKGFAEAAEERFGYELIHGDGHGGVHGGGHGGGPPATTLLFRARLVVALLSAGTALLVFAAARRAARAFAVGASASNGPAAARTPRAADAAGLAALALYALDPLVISHAGLATLDAGAAAFTLAAALAYPGALRDGGARRVGAAGLATALALGTKFSTLPLLAGLAAIAALLASGRVPGAPRRPVLARRLGAVLLVAAAALAIVCLPEGPGFLARAFELQRAHAERGHPAFAFGQYATEGWWWYFPAAWAVKMPLPVLALSLAGVVAVVRRARHAPSAAATLLVTPALLALASLASPIAIGVRHLLPVVPFLAIAGGLGAADLGRVRPGRRLVRPGRLAVQPGRLVVGARRLLATAALAWLAIGTLAVHPHELSYGNELAGGPGGLARVLTDSNVDWGLGLPDLAAFVAERPTARLYLAYFGGGDPAAYGLRHYRWLPAANYAPRLQQDGPDPSGRELVAVSLSSLADPVTPGHATYAWLRARPPVAVAGRSLAVFDITGDADAHRRVAASALARGAPLAALGALRRAAEIFGAEGRWPEAARVCAEAERIRARATGALSAAERGAGGRGAGEPGAGAQGAGAPGAGAFSATATCREAAARAAATAGAATPPPSPR